MAHVLEELGFSVILENNADRRQMREAVNKFRNELHNSAIGLFFYSGHGLHVQGKNYLIPINAKIETDSDVEFEAIDLDYIFNAMQESNNKTNIVILDACRIVSFRNVRSIKNGLNMINPPGGFIIALANTPGKVASDGMGRNSIYTQSLLKHLAQPGLEITQIFKKVRRDVFRHTNGANIPWETSSLSATIYLNDRNLPEASSTNSNQAYLSVESAVTGAGVYVDGKYAGQTPLNYYAVSSGQHIIMVIRDGYQTYERRLEFSKGQTITLNLSLETITAPVSHLYVNTEPHDARVRILNIAAPFYQGIELPLGWYYVEISSVGYTTHNLWVDLNSKHDTNITVNLNQNSAQHFVSSISNQKLNDIVDKLKEATIAFNKPSKMKLKKVEAIELVLKPGATLEEVKAMINMKPSNNTEMVVQTSKIKISEIVEAKLRGASFDIESISQERQPISFKDETRWKWMIRPLEFGRQRLFLTVDAVVNYNDKEEKRTIRTFDEEILVEVEGFHWVYYFVALLILGCLGLITYFFLRKKNRHFISTNYNYSNKEHVDKNTDIFVSYSRKDMKEVEKIIDAINKTGAKIWIDQSGIEAGSLWSEEIVRAILSAKMILFIASANAFLSDNVAKEISIASENNKPILPILLHQTEIPEKFQYQLTGIQHILLTKNTPDQFFNLIQRALVDLGVITTKKG